MIRLPQEEITCVSLRRTCKPLLSFHRYEKHLSRAVGNHVSGNQCRCWEEHVDSTQKWRINVTSHWSNQRGNRWEKYSYLDSLNKILTVSQYRSNIFRWIISSILRTRLLAVSTKWRTAFLIISNMLWWDWIWFSHEIMFLHLCPFNGYMIHNPMHRLETAYKWLPNQISGFLKGLQACVEGLDYKSYDYSLMQIMVSISLLYRAPFDAVITYGTAFMLRDTKTFWAFGTWHFLTQLFTYVHF